MITKLKPLHYIFQFEKQNINKQNVFAIFKPGTQDQHCPPSENVEN